MSDELERSRRRFEAGLEELRGASVAELGWAPRMARWAVPVVAAAVGLTVGLMVRRGLPRALLRSRSED